jgi:hypothetical protein
MKITESARAGYVRRVLPLLLAAAWAAGCSAGSGEGLNISGRPIDEGGDVPLAATLASIQANVFDPSCIVCHSGATAPLGLLLDQANSFTNLVGVRSVENSSTFRVDPGNPDQSYLIHKLEGTASTGAQMPLGGPPIPQATIDFVRQWIIDGAQNTNSSVRETTLKVLSLQPDPGLVISTFPAQIMVAFNQPIDASTIHGQTIELRRSGGDGVFGNGNDVVVTPSFVEVSLLNPQLAILDMSGLMPVDDRYQITVHGTGPSVVLGNSGVALDGDFTGAFPSGDNIAGGDFVAEFSIQGEQ